MLFGDCNVQQCAWNKRYEHISPRALRPRRPESHPPFYFVSKIGGFRGIPSLSPPVQQHRRAWLLVAWFVAPIENRVVRITTKPPLVLAGEVLRVAETFKCAILFYAFARQGRFLHLPVARVDCVQLACLLSSVHSFPLAVQGFFPELGRLAGPSGLLDSLCEGVILLRKRAGHLFALRRVACRKDVKIF